MLKGGKGKINSHCDSTNKIKLVESDSKCLEQHSLQGSVQGRTLKSCQWSLSDKRDSHLKEEYSRDKARNKSPRKVLGFFLNFLDLIMLVLLNYREKFYKFLEYILDNFSEIKIIYLLKIIIITFARKILRTWLYLVWSFFVIFSIFVSSYWIAARFSTILILNVKQILVFKFISIIYGIFSRDF